MKKFSCAITGATGSVGQKLISYLDKHPYFEISALAASERSAGKKYAEAIKGREFFEKMDTKPPSEDILEMKVYNIKNIKPENFDLIFSALDPRIAEKYEMKFAEETPVFTAASFGRHRADVPILTPGVNDAHSQLLKIQQKRRNWKGYICTKSNCTVTGLVYVLFLLKNYGIKYVRVYTEQALSGAGERGLAENSEYRRMLKKLGKFPYVEGEEPKVEFEPKKILGKLHADEERIEDASFDIDAFCTRVSRDNVHMEEVFVQTTEDFELDELMNKMPDLKDLNLPSLPRYPISLWKTKIKPEEHVEVHGTMNIGVGEFRKPYDKTMACRLTVDNTGIGAGGNLVANAEYCALNDLI